MMPNQKLNKMLTFQKDTRTFEERLEVGQQKEIYLVDILNLCGVPAKRNNDGNVYDIDLELTYDDMFMDCKLAETPFHKAKEILGIDPDKCLPMQVRHIRNYEQKEKETGKPSWIAYFVDFKDYNVYELIFIPNSQLVHLINTYPEKIKDGRISFDRSIGRDMHTFLSYIKQIRNIKKR